MTEQKNTLVEREKAQLRARLQQLERLEEGESAPPAVGPSYAPLSPVHHIPELEAMVQSLYPDKEVQQTILEDIAVHGTAEAILAGELVLPSPEDAHRHHHGVNAAEYEKELSRRR